MIIGNYFDFGLTAPARRKLFGQADAILEANNSMKSLGKIKGEAIRDWKPTTLTAIPYYAWAHREIDEMGVWLDTN